jgi:hypothetical protein
MAEILELGRAIFGTFISHCAVEPGSGVPSLTRGAKSACFDGAGAWLRGSATGPLLGIPSGTIDFADSSATNNVDHCTRKWNLAVRSTSPASPVVSAIRRDESTILACESNICDLPGNTAKRPGEAGAGASARTTYTQYDGALSIAVQHLEVRAQLRYNLVGSFFWR